MYRRSLLFLFYFLLPAFFLVIVPQVESFEEFLLSILTDIALPPKSDMHPDVATCQLEENNLKSGLNFVIT